MNCTLCCILCCFSLVPSITALFVALHRKRKPSLQAAVARGVAYGSKVGKDEADIIQHSCAAVIREDIGDNGKRDWLDATIRFEVEALLHHSRK